MKNKKCKMTPADPLPPKWNFPLFLNPSLIWPFVEALELSKYIF